MALAENKDEIILILDYSFYLIIVPSCSTYIYSGHISILIKIRPGLFHTSLCGGLPNPQSRTGGPEGV